MSSPRLEVVDAPERRGVRRAMAGDRHRAAAPGHGFSGRGPVPCAGESLSVPSTTTYLTPIAGMRMRPAASPFGAPALERPGQEAELAVVGLQPAEHAGLEGRRPGLLEVVEVAAERALRDLA
jgi:hypothetical protein